MNDSCVLNSKAINQLASLRVHAMKGCLSEIPPGAGTNQNKNLHSKMNPFFSRCHMGIPLAGALLTILFHRHNYKSDSTSSILSTRASYKRESSNLPDQSFTFGILKKSEIPYKNSWVFGPRIHGRSAYLEVSPDELKEIHLTVDFVDLQDLFSTLHPALELWKLSQSVHELSNHSPLLNQKTILFMSHVSCLFEHGRDEVSESEQHQKRLLDIV